MLRTHTPVPAQDPYAGPAGYAGWLAGQAGYEVVLTNPESGTATGANDVTVVFYAHDGTETGSTREPTVEGVIVPGGSSPGGSPTSPPGPLPAQSWAGTKEAARGTLTWPDDLASLVKQESNHGLQRHDR